MHGVGNKKTNSGDFCLYFEFKWMAGPCTVKNGIWLRLLVAGAEEHLTGFISSKFSRVTEVIE